MKSEESVSSDKQPQEPAGSNSSGQMELAMLQQRDLEEFDAEASQMSRRIDSNQLPARWSMVQVKQKLGGWLASRYVRVRDALPVYVVLLSLAFYQWYQSLGSCEDDITECVQKLKREVPRIMMHVVKFCLFTFALLIFAMRQKDVLSRRIGVGSVVAVYAYIGMTSKGFSTQDHSQVNMAVAFIVFGLLIAVTGLCLCLARLWKRSKKVVFFLVLCIFGSAWAFYRVRVVPSCRHLNDSLHPDFTYSDSGTECKWLQPTVCWHYAIKGLYKPIFWGRSRCDQYATDLSLHRMRSAPSGIISYPQSNQIDYDYRTYLTRFQNEINSKIARSTQEEIDSGDKEVFIDFRRVPEGEVILKLRDLRKKSPGLNLLPHDKDHLNILHLFVDTVSRQRLFRRFTKTAEILKDYHFTKNKKIRSYEFFRFHAIVPWTSYNLISSVYGSIDGLSSEKKRIESFAKDRGYVTGFTNNFCQPNEMDHDYKPGYSTDKRFEDRQTPDHEMIQLACDYNNFPKENGLGFFFTPGPYTASRKCFMKKDLSQFSFDYTLDFFRMYREERKFFTLRLIDPHEFTEEVGGFLDDPLSRFLSKMIEEGHLDNTIVYLNSDHGDHINFLLSDTPSFRSERFNPFLVVLLPDGLKDGIGKTVELNTQKLLSHEDLFASDMKYLGFGDHPQVKGQSILQSAVPDRLCKQAGIFDCMCTT